MPYNVQFEVFEGPMDLLLYLVRKQEVDIYQVNLTQLASEFIEYVEFMRELDLEVAGEFVVMAATLMYIKSKELLPKDKQVVLEDDEEEADPRWELIQQLVEYKKFKDAASDLKALELEQESVFPVGHPNRISNSSKTGQHPSRMWMSLTWSRQSGPFYSALRKKMPTPEKSKRMFGRSVKRLKCFVSGSRRRAVFAFPNFFAQDRTRNEVVVTFLALLEMIRMKQLRALQSTPFEEIEICVAEAMDPDSLENDEEETAHQDPPLTPEGS